MGQWKNWLGSSSYIVNKYLIITTIIASVTVTAATATTNTRTVSAFFDKINGRFHYYLWSSKKSQDS